MPFLDIMEGTTFVDESRFLLDHYGPKPRDRKCLKIANLTIL